MERLFQGDPYSDIQVSKQLKLHTVNVFVTVDDFHYERLRQFKWYFNGGKTCIHRNDKVNGKHSTVSLACEVMQVRGVMFDHKNRNNLDNQQHNLRPANKSQNAANQGKKPNCSSQYKGVTWQQPRRKWVAQIRSNYKNINLGGFEIEKDAALAYDKKARELFGEFANPNFKIT